MSKKILFISDTHGDVERVNEIIATNPDVDLVFHLGDYGFGFIDNPPVYPEKVKILLGNHDCPYVIGQHPNVLNDWGYIEEYDLFYVRGAWSIDYKRRTAYKTWWPEEEIGVESCYAAFQAYNKIKPSLVVTHDVPLALYPSLDLPLSNQTIFHTPTNVFLQSLFVEHKPKNWIGAHFHQHFKRKILGTEFLIMPINQYCVMNLHSRKITRSY